MSSQWSPQTVDDIWKLARSDNTNTVALLTELVNREREPWMWRTNYRDPSHYAPANFFRTEALLALAEIGDKRSLALLVRFLGERGSNGERVMRGVLKAASEDSQSVTAVLKDNWPTDNHDLDTEILNFITPKNRELAVKLLKRRLSSVTNDYGDTRLDYLRQAFRNRCGPEHADAIGMMLRDCIDADSHKKAELICNILHDIGGSKAQHAKGLLLKELHRTRRGNDYNDVRLAAARTLISWGVVEWLPKMAWDLSGSLSQGDLIPLGIVLAGISHLSAEHLAYLSTFSDVNYDEEVAVRDTGWTTGDHDYKLHTVKRTTDTSTLREAACAQLALLEQGDKRETL